MVLVEIFEGCPLDCPYCYARPQAQRFRRPFDLKAFSDMVASLSPNTFVLHGQEPFVLPLHVLQAIVDTIREANPCNSVTAQTSALPLLEPERFDWAVEELNGVGFSWDGEAASPVGRQRVAKEVLGVIARYAKAKGDAGVIWVLTNETTEAQLRQGIETLIRAGVKTIRLNAVHAPYTPIQPEHYASLLLAAAPYRKDVQLTTVEAILGKIPDCAFSGCCPYGTVIPGLTLDGELVCCGKEEAVSWARRSSFRMNLLQELPEQEGGCRGCEDFSICRGGCPATAAVPILRTALCPAYRRVRDALG
ncbi:MAG: hypothetical protein QXK45_06695 [Thermofilaceae archaeon]